MTKFPAVQALTFDLFGTVLDLGGSLTPAIASYLRDKGSSVPPEHLWNQWRARQRLEQYQDNILLLGHSGYLETVRRALIYVLALEGIDAARGGCPPGSWKPGSISTPSPMCGPPSKSCRRRYRLIALSNGGADFLNSSGDQSHWLEFRPHYLGRRSRCLQAAPWGVSPSRGLAAPRNGTVHDGFGQFIRRDWGRGPAV